MAVAHVPGSASGSGSPGSGSPGRDRRPGGTRALAGLVLGIGAPIAVYYLLHSLGVGNLVALGAGAAFPALSAGYTLAVKRRADGVALFVLTTIVASILVSVIARDPRFLLAKDGLITGLWGLWFLASVPARRPAAFTLARPLLEGRKMFTVRDWDALWEAEPAFPPHLACLDRDVGNRTARRRRDPGGDVLHAAGDGGARPERGAVAGDLRGPAGRHQHLLPVRGPEPMLGARWLARPGRRSGRR